MLKNSNKIYVCMNHVYRGEVQGRASHGGNHIKEIVPHSHVTSGIGDVSSVIDYFERKVGIPIK